MSPFLRFCLLGLLVAGLDEFITQGVLKNTYAGWILPTLIAFVPFLALVRLIGKILDKRLSEPESFLICYLTAGSIGLAVEWFLIGLSPWSKPDAPIHRHVPLSIWHVQFLGQRCDRTTFAP